MTTSSCTANGAVYFTLTIGNDAPRYFVCRVGGLALKIGRANNNDLILSLSGISARHLEFKVPALYNGGPGQLALQDLSTNGIGITFSDNGPLIRLDRGVDMDVPANSFYLHLPYNVKPGRGSPAESRIVMKVDILTAAEVSALTSGVAACRDWGGRAGALHRATRDLPPVQPPPRHCLGYPLLWFLILTTRQCRSKARE